MKYLKILGLAAVAAMALTAFVGAGSASATVLCTTTSTPCGSSWHVDEFTASLVGTAIHETTGGTVLDTCTGGLAGSTKETTGSSTDTFSGLIFPEDLTWSGCTRTTDTLEGGTIEFHHIPGTHNGTVTVRDFTWTINTIFGSCTFGFSSEYTHIGTLDGGHTAKLTINTILPRKSGPCPSESRWTATYHITTHTSVYVEPS